MRNEKGSILVLCMMLLVVVTLLAVAGIQTGSFGTMIAGNGLEGQKAFWIAEAGLQDAKDKLNNAADIEAFKTLIGPSIQVVFGEGTYKITTSIDTFDLINRIKVISVGSTSRASRTAEVTMIKMKANPKTWAALAANGSVNTIGNFTADGRDWDENGMVPLSNGEGSFGIATRNTLNLGGSSSVGGTVAGIDYAPPDKGLGNPGVVSENPNQPLMTSPDNALGLPEGTLKNMAQSNGTYYENGNLVPSGPISGVTYVEGNFATADGEGVLVVTGTLGNFHGNFKGIIIANCVDKANGNSQIVGTLLTMTTAAADVLNGTADILFSKARIKRSLDSVSGVKLIAWREVKN